MQLLGLPCASEKSTKNARVPLPLLLQLLIAMALLVLQAMSTILQLMLSKFPYIPPNTPLSPPSPPSLPTPRHTSNGVHRPRSTSSPPHNWKTVRKPVTNEVLDKVVSEGGPYSNIF